MPVSARQALEELHSRVHRPALSLEAPPRLPELVSSLFAKQREVLGCLARKIAVLCTRRAGKTTLVPAALFQAAEDNPGCVVLFVGRTLKRAKQLAWENLTRDNTSYRLGYAVNHTTLTLYNPRNGAEIRLYGADNAKEIEKARGDKIALAAIDECQSMDDDILTRLVDDILMPGLMDVGGRLILLGTPGYACAGYWYNLTRNEDPTEHVSDSRALRVTGWVVFEWGCLDNTARNHLGQRLCDVFARELEGIIADAPGGRQNARVRREWLGKWCVDAAGLFYSFDKERNLYDGALPRGHSWSYGAGVDLGKAFAIVVHAYAPTHPVVYEVKSIKLHDANANDWRAQTAKVIDEFNLDYCVVDYGGLGVATIEAWQQEGLPVQPAEKSSRDDFVALMNAEMEAGRVKAITGSPLAHEYGTLARDQKTPPGLPPQPVANMDDHCCDAGLYSWRRAYQLCGREDKPAPEPGTVEYDRERSRQEKMAYIQSRAMDSGFGEGW